MLAIIATAALDLIEKELIAKEPEIESLIIDQVRRLADTLMAYVDSKMEKSNG